MNSHDTSPAADDVVAGGQMPVQSVGAAGLFPADADDHRLLANDSTSLAYEGLPVLDDVALHSILRRLGGSVDDRSHGREVDVLPQEFRRSRELQRCLLGGGGHVPQAGAAQDGSHGAGVVHREHGANEPAEVGADVLHEGAL